MNDRFTMNPTPLACGGVFEEQRLFESRWLETSDNKWSTSVPERHEYGHVHKSKRREEVQSAFANRINVLAVSYQGWHESEAMDGQSFGRGELQGKSFVVEGKPPLVAVRGAATDAEKELIEFEYAGLGEIEPVFEAAPPASIAVGDEVTSMSALVHHLLHRGARSRAGYSTTEPLTIDARLAALRPTPDGRAGVFAVHIEAASGAPDGLRLDGELGIGPNGWPRWFQVTGTLKTSIRNRIGETTIDAHLVLTFAWL